MNSKQTFPPLRINEACGRDHNIAVGREPCQSGWYEFAGLWHCRGKTVLDAGAGTCAGLSILRGYGAESVWGQDIDPRLQEQDNQLIIKPLSELSDHSFDVVTCFDVIEHVIDDLEFVGHLKRIAKETLIITTPNYTRSEAKNLHHCREYTFPQFLNYFQPDELWTASPDGKVNRRRLMLRSNGVYVNDTCKESYPVGEVPDSLSFAHSSVDGLEWPHICGIFHRKSTTHDPKGIGASLLPRR